MPSFDGAMLFDGRYHQWLVHGFLVSLQLAAFALASALPLAVVVALLRLAPQRLLRAVGTCYVEGIRSVPLLAHLLFWYFAAPELLPASIKEWLYSADVEFITAVIGLSLYTAAYMAEDIRSGVRSIPAVQFEAGRALGFGFIETMRLVILPQAMRVTVPPLLSQTLNLWKDTSIATVIGVGELMYQAARVETATFRSAEPFAFATLAYLTVSLLLAALAAFCHQRLAVGSR